MNEPTKLISAEKLAALTGLTDRRHRQLAAEGFFPPPTRGMYLFTKTVAGLFRYFRERKDERAELLRETVRQRRGQADLLELERKKQEAELITSTQATDIMRGFLMPLREGILAAPDVLAARVNPADPELARGELDRWARNLLRDATSAGEKYKA